MILFVVTAALVPKNNIWTQGVIESYLYPESVISGPSLTGSELVMPGCKKEGFLGIEFTTAAMGSSITNPNYDPNSEDETTFRNSYLLVGSYLTSGPQYVEFSEIIVTDFDNEDIVTKFEINFLETKELIVEGASNYKIFATLFEVILEISIPNTVETMPTPFGGSSKEARFFLHHLNSIVAPGVDIVILSGSIENFDIEDFDHETDLLDLTPLGKVSDYSAMEYVLIDGTASPQELSNFVKPHPNYYGPPTLLAHPDVACLDASGNGLGNVLMLEGDLIVDIDYCYLNDEEDKHSDPDPRSNPNGKYLYMGPDSRIIIESGVEFTIDRTIILSCNTLWNSIVVKDGATLNVYDSYIRDGIHAIKVEEGGTVNVHNNIFDGNFISFYTPPSQSSGRYSINMGPFYGNEFIDMNGLHDFPDGYTGIEPEVPFAAIQINDLANFTAGGVGPAGQVEPNTIEDIPYGIFANHSSVFIQNYSISNAYLHEEQGEKPFGGIGILLNQKSLIPSEIIGNGKTSGIANINNAEVAGIDAMNGVNQIRENVVVDTEIGVRLNQTRLSIHVLNENYIESKNYGIFHQTVAGGFTNVLNNEILMRSTTAPPSGEFNYGIALHGFGFTGAGGRLIENNQITLLDNSHKGVYSNSVSHLRIRENNIEDQEDNDNFMGIGISNSPFSLIDYNTTGGSVLTSKVSTSLLLRSSHSTRINCNATENSLYGIQVVENSDASELKGNQIRTHQHYGLLYGYGPSTNQTEPHLTGIQRHHGNIWSECYETPSCNLGGLHTNRPNIVEQSEFFVDPTNSQFTTTRDPYDWFKDEPESVTWTCPEERPQSPWYDFTPESNPTEWDEKMVLDFDVFDDNPYFESWRSVSERNLFERIMMDQYESSALNSPVLDSFIQKHEYSNIAVLYNVRQIMASALDLTEVQWMEVEDKVDSIYIEVAALFELDSLAWADTTSVDTAQWLSDRTQIQESIHIIQSNLDSYAELHSTDIEGVSNQVQSTLGTLTAQTPPEAYEIEMLALISATVFQAEWDFTAQERTTIENTADLCPAFGGPAVFWARNLRESFDPGTVYNDTLCTEQWGERILRDTEEQGSSVLVYPNPATDEIKVDGSGMDFDRWVIYSMDGIRVSHGEMNAEDSFSINTSELRTGIYFLRLSGPDSLESIPFNIQRIGQ